MLNRRNILAATPSAALAATTKENKFDPFKQDAKQQQYHNIRFPKLDHESLQDFVVGFKNFQGSEGGAARAAHDKFLKASGLPTGDSNHGFEEAHKIMLGDSVYAARTRLSRSCQHLMWDRAQRVFHNDADHFLGLMEETDAKGPGKLELNPDMKLPDYTTHEIHTQPGGYVGDPFAGWIYHYAVNTGFFQGRSDHEEIHLAIAQAHPMPADGEVKRVLDIGCGTGQSTTSIKERFPNAEVWGIDVGGPMVRYAHHRAVKMNLDVNFAQRIAEDTKFPDNYFDIVTDHIVFHEVPAVEAKQIVAEMHRVLRPGGVFSHVDVGTTGHPKYVGPNTLPAKASVWVDHRLNFEPWTIQYRLSDFPNVLRQAGFEVDTEVPANRWNMYPGVAATKKA